MNIKEQLIKICKDIIKENNKEFNFIDYEATGISNHIFDEKGVQMKIGLELKVVMVLFFRIREQKQTDNIVFFGIYID